MQRRLGLLLLCLAGCLQPVDDKWCDVGRPCDPGFYCDASFHCVRGLLPVTGGGGGRDAGSTGGGGNTGGGGGGGGAIPTGGGGSLTGGGGGATGGGGPTGGGNPIGGGGGMNCALGCFEGTVCVPFAVQTPQQCGQGNQVCRACGPGESCRSGACFPAPVTNVGAPCLTDAACGTGRCLTEDVGFPGGYCTQFCDNVPCVGTSTCIQAQTPEGQEFELCLSTCSDTLECRIGYVCDNGICLPP